MAKNDLNKVDIELEEARKKVASLETKREQIKENILKSIGKTYVAIQLKKDKNKSYQDIDDELKLELQLIKDEEKANRQAAKKSQENEASSDEHSH